MKILFCHLPDKYLFNLQNKQQKSLKGQQTS
jgi:hypothetical protein